MLFDKIYAHNPPIGNEVDPTDDSQIVTFQFRYLHNNTAQPEKDVSWYIYPRPVDLVFFDSNNAIVAPATNQSPIITKTDANGFSVLKIGSKSRHLGTISAAPNDDFNSNSLQYSFVIATFNSGDITTSLYPAIYDPNPIAIPLSPSANNPGFDVTIAALPSNFAGQRVVFWISSGALGETPQENIEIMSLSKGQQGITVPYSYVYPDPNPTGRNTISYMVVAADTSASSLARPVGPAVTGPRMSHHPDYTNTNRTLPNPHLQYNANVINGNNIVGGLDVYIPYSSTWIAGGTINFELYLIGEDDRGNTLSQPQVITPEQITAQKDITIHFTQEQLAGYQSGTIEADYYIAENWSKILEGVTLDTLYWW